MRESANPKAGWKQAGGGTEVVMAEVDVIVQDHVTGLFGFRLELGRDRAGARMQARRGGFVTANAALAEYRRLSRQRDARRLRLRLSDTVQTVCEEWLSSRVQELAPKGYQALTRHDDRVVVQDAAKNVRYAATAWPKLRAHVDLDDPAPVLVGQLWDLTVLVGERAAARELREKLQMAGHGVPDGTTTAAELADRITRIDADLARLTVNIDQRRTHLWRLADEVARFLTEQQALARARAMIRDVDQRRGLSAPPVDAARELADHTAVLAAYRELTQSPEPATR
jgi:hypothetical protein